MISWIKREQSHKHSRSTDRPLNETPGPSDRTDANRNLAPSANVDVPSKSLAPPTPAPAPPIASVSRLRSSSVIHSRIESTLGSPEPMETKQRAFTAALNHPHDSVIAELQGHRPDHDTSARMDASARARSPFTLQSADTLPTATLSEAVGATPAQADVDKAKIFDPFSGNPIGTISSAAKASQAREELWTHLGRIRELQADIAQMHVMMEGVGLGDKPGMSASRSRGKRSRGRSGVGDTLDLGVGEGDLRTGADEVDEATKEERDWEFEAADAKFDGRKEGIDKIMGKLGELAQALATFHALETPTTDFGSRSNTMASHASHTGGATLSMPTSPASLPNHEPPPIEILSDSPTILTPRSRTLLHKNQE